MALMMSDVTWQLLAITKKGSRSADGHTARYSRNFVARMKRGW